MKILGHRGYNISGKPYQNSFSAIEKVLENGADGVEIDIISSSDDICYLIHDEEISKHSDVDCGNLTELTSEQIDIKKIGKNGEYYPIARLVDVLDLFRDKYSDRILNIEMKQENIAQKIHDIVKNYPEIKSNIVISSFNHDDLFTYRSFDEDIKIGLLFDSRNDDEKDSEEYLEYLNELAKKLGNVAFHPNVNSSLIASLNGEKNIWTVLEEHLPRLSEMRNFGNFNIIVDDYDKVNVIAKKLGLK